MSNKVASVGLVLRPQGFLAGIRNARGQFVKDVAAMKASAGTLDKTIQKQTQSLKEAAKALPAAMSAPPSNGLLSWLRNLETRSKETARKIGDSFRGAFEQAEGGGRARRGRARGGPLGAGALIAYDQIKRLASFAADTTRDINSTHERAVQLSVNARKGGGQYIAPAQLEAQAYATASDVKGTTADQALEAMSAFVTLTGDIKTAQSSITTFALASKASGADMKDVAEATASISKQFGIVDPKQIRDVLAAMIYQGKEGAIMLPDQARGLQKIAAAGAAFGVSKDVGGVKKLGGLLQMARGGTGTSEQAFTAVEAVFRGLTEKGKELQAQHVKVYEGTGAKKKTRSIDDILIDVVSKAGGKDIGKKNAAISEIFGSEGMRAISPMVGIYQTAFQGAKGKGGGAATDAERTAAGIAALRESLDGLVHASGEWTDVMDDAAKMQGTASAKTTAAWEEFKGKMAAGVLPALGKLVDKLGEGDMGVDTLVNSFAMVAEAAGALVDVLKSAGIIKEKSSFDKAKAAQARVLRYQEELESTEVTPEMKKKNPAEAARREKKAADLKEKLVKAGQEEFDFATKSFNEGTKDFTLQQAFPELYKGKAAAVSGGGKLDAKFREQYAAKQAAGGAALTSPWATGAAPAGGAPGAPPGPVKIDGAIKIGGVTSPLPIRIVADDSKRGAGAAPPAPGAAPR